MMGLLANAVDPSDWTLWETPRLLVHVHVTVAPTATVSTAGFAVPLWALMKTTCPLFPTVTDPNRPPAPPPPPRHPPPPPPAPPRPPPPRGPPLKRRTRLRAYRATSRRIDMMSTL